MKLVCVEIWFVFLVEIARKSVNTELLKDEISSAEERELQPRQA
ncbi:hypothetical protein [Turicimonas muris]|nr:hypothetical protein [Turicimonas muris]